jgi:hypothetical protein
MTARGFGRPLRYRIPRGSLGPWPAFFYIKEVTRDVGGIRRFAAAIVLALLLHAGVLGASFLSAAPSPPPPQIAITQTVALQKEPPPPLPPPEPPVRRPPSRARAPAAAAAGKVIAQAPEPNRPLDMTGFDMVIGKGNVYAGGITAASGTSLTAVADVRATPRGASQVRSAAPSRTDWACGWPQEEQDNSDVRSVRVLIRVHVDRDGEPQGVDVLGPAAATFEQAARHCALNESYLSARDESGRAVPGTTSPFSVHFFR